MKKRITRINYDNIKREYWRTIQWEAEYPSVCPLCNTATHLEELYGYADTLPDETIIVSVLFSCPSCRHCFIGEYKIDDFTTLDINLIDFVPKNHHELTFPENINILSPEFCKIYNQSYTAQQYGLNQICGMGYRKSIEILIKDFAIKCYPDKVEEIKSKMLGYCIDHYIDIPKIKSLAKAAAWIGNDETHYEKRLIGADVEKMKSFISAAVKLIDADLECINSVQFINSNK